MNWTPEMVDAHNERVAQSRRVRGAVLATTYDAVQTHSLPPDTKPEQTVLDKPLGQAEGKEGHAARLSVCIKSYRSRLIDPDNLCPKYAVDCLRYAKIIADDTAKDIKITVEQELCEKGQERTEIVVASIKP